MPAFQSAFLAGTPNAFGTCARRAANDVSAAADFTPGNLVGGIAEYDAIDGWLQPSARARPRPWSPPSSRGWA